MYKKSSSLVPNKHTAAKYLSNSLVLALITWVIVLLMGNIMVQEFIAIIHHVKGDEEVYKIVKQEQTISVMLVALGVLLEGRQLLLGWFCTEQEIQKEQDKNLACEYYGFIIMSIGLLIEIIDQFLTFTIKDSDWLLIVVFSINYPLNFYALIMLMTIGLKLTFPLRKQNVKL